MLGKIWTVTTEDKQWKTIIEKKKIMQTKRKEKKLPRITLAKQELDISKDFVMIQ